MLFCEGIGHARGETAVDSDEIEGEDESAFPRRILEDEGFGVEIGLLALGGGGARSVAGHPERLGGCDHDGSGPGSPAFGAEGGGQEKSGTEQKFEAIHRPEGNRNRPPMASPGHGAIKARVRRVSRENDGEDSHPGNACDEAYRIGKVRFC
jgi:hypothetical protein